MLNDWASSRNTSTPTEIVFLDLTKVFDSVSHERLFLKLEGYGIEGNLLQWFTIETSRQIGNNARLWEVPPPHGLLSDLEFLREQFLALSYSSFI